MDRYTSKTNQNESGVESIMMEARRRLLLLLQLLRWKGS